MLPPMLTDANIGRIGFPKVVAEAGTHLLAFGTEASIQIRIEIAGAPHQRQGHQGISHIIGIHDRLQVSIGTHSNHCCTLDLVRSLQTALKPESKEHALGAEASHEKIEAKIIPDAELSRAIGNGGKQQIDQRGISMHVAAP